MYDGVTEMFIIFGFASIRLDVPTILYAYFYENSYYNIK